MISFFYVKLDGKNARDVVSVSPTIVVNFVTLHKSIKSIMADSLTYESICIHFFTRALDSSDPILSSVSQVERQKRRRRKVIPHEVLLLLKNPEVSLTKVYQVDAEEDLDDDEDNIEDFYQQISTELDNVFLVNDTCYEDFC